MQGLLDRRLLVVTGKGGVGKTTVATAIGLLAAGEGLRTIIVGVGARSRTHALFGVRAAEAGVELELETDLWGLAVDPDRALMEWLQALGGRVPGRVLASSGTFQYFAAAAPGVRELVTMVKIWELAQAKRWRRRGAGYDLVVLDAPSTGHALALLDSPRTFGAIARVGPIASQTRRIRELLGDKRRTGYLAVAAGTEMAIDETLELKAKLSAQLDRQLDAALVNGTIPPRFTPAELHTLASLEDQNDPTLRAAASAARDTYERARFQRNQIARLRRRGLEVHTIPLQFESELDLAGVRRIAAHLAGKL
jgi:anion-transporting  ArsA/GET3 family ATPase